MREHCHNNRTQPAPGFFAEDREFVGGRLVKTTRWIPARWIDGAAKCGQAAPGNPVWRGCAGCGELDNV